MLYQVSYDFLALIFGDTVNAIGYDKFFPWFVFAFTLFVFWCFIVQPFIWFFKRVLPGGCKRKGFNKYEEI